ncbi:glyoxalase [Bacillus sp. MKU004]|uniref:VOC family protein n=1 Tax=[Bacillus] enclensis TaxID=1402860 RepID=UPI0007E36861|nr:VOC family protein [[Bacillus] enclensis]MBH9965235.1 VOC family protein [[Bacillus] enclensis]OAT82635.1 glyoxalase [Bacillus sp. MKU004]
MKNKLMRVGTTYIPVSDVEKAASWYSATLEAVLNYKDEEKAILELANHSLFLVKAKEGETANFQDHNGRIRFSMTFEVEGMEALNSLHSELNRKGIMVGDIENRGHAGRNFVFTDLDGNKFDVWSELSPVFKEMMIKK